MATLIRKRVLDIYVLKEQPSDVESLLNSIVFFLIQIPHIIPICRQLITSFRGRLLASVIERIALVWLRVLQNLLEGLGTNIALKYDVYLSLL